MTEPNDRLLQARERMPSRTCPGEQMSRHELAELINSWIFHRTGEVVLIDGNYVGKLERGKIRWPGKLYREAFRAVLNAATDWQLGFYGRRRKPVTVDDMDRQQFLRATGAAIALPWLDMLSPIVPTDVPSVVTTADIEQIHNAVCVFASWDNAYGGGLAREAVFSQLQWSSRLLQCRCDASLQPELFSAVAQLGGVAGFMAFDAFAHDDARRAFRFALACAEHSGDWQVRGSILTDMARQAMWLNEPDSALTYVEMALVRAERLTATEKAMLHAVRARCLAQLNQPQESLAAIGVADEAMSESRPELDPPWMGFYSEAQHHGDTGQALFTLGIQGHRGQGRERLASAARGYAPTLIRPRALAQIKLASLTMATGDPREGAVIGQAALDCAGALRSKRAADDLRELVMFASRHGGIGEARDLVERVRVHLRQ